MILCLCEAVRLDRVREAIEAGAETPEEIGAACGAGTDCGACLDSLVELLRARPRPCAAGRSRPSFDER